MEELPLINEFLILFTLSIIVLLTCHRVRIPPVVGFLLTGVMCGPYGFALIQHVEDVQSLAGIGIILLLFTVGMEVSIKKIIEIRQLFFLGGLFQLALTTFGGFLVARLLDRPIGEAIFLGFLLTLSSTAVVLRILVQKGESDTHHGRGTLAILIFQDFCAVPMMLITPYLAGSTDTSLNLSLLISGVKGIAIIATVFLMAWWIVPKLLYLVAKTRIRELFLVSVICICLVVAWFAQLAGLSLSLGAFLAGLIISQSDFSHEAISDIAPFQDLFTSFFFVSIGMLLDVDFVMQHPFLILSLTLGVILLKSVTGILASLGAGLPLRTAAWVGISLAQIGEFSFVLARTGDEAGIVPAFQYQLFLAVAILTIACTPWLLNFAHTWAGLWDSLPFPEILKKGYKAPKPVTVAELKDHVIIIGFGLSGRTLARSCKSSSVPYIVVEMNAQTVKHESMRGEPIHFGDASHESVLEHVRIHEAKVAAVVINDPTAAIRIIKKIKQINPSLFLIVRTRYVQDVPLYYSTGADEVIPDEYGSAIEVYTRVLRKCSVPRDTIQSLVALSLEEGFALQRMQYYPTLYKNEPQIISDDLAIRSMTVDEKCSCVGKQIEEYKNNEFGVTFIGLKRGQKLFTQAFEDLVIQKNDEIIVMGEPNSLKVFKC